MPDIWATVGFECLKQMFAVRYLFIFKLGAGDLTIWYHDVNFLHGTVDLLKKKIVTVSIEHDKHDGSYLLETHMPHFQVRY